ncbi:hypothetical protein TRFO_14223 [Tritrichomonas foetus]|uniref:Uncharacterized protein n=1 Tax=Tritrichomonas foetus TaxID=1144522 RepID=A0A1J4KVH6_9EUKA|nr:hypothetical protein TRFO_14223 [Tritrichomonas foetus]|eukprot:OHT15313.1 hypothetical protein TRFO_14223 [Tritrichomonas foetus]
MIDDCEVFFSPLSFPNSPSEVHFEFDSNPLEVDTGPPQQQIGIPDIECDIVKESEAKSPSELHPDQCISLEPNQLNNFIPCNSQFVNPTANHQLPLQMNQFHARMSHLRGFISPQMPQYMGPIPFTFMLSPNQKHKKKKEKVVLNDSQKEFRRRVVAIFTTKKTVCKKLIVDLFNRVADRLGLKKMAREHYRSINHFYLDYVDQADQIVRAMAAEFELCNSATCSLPANADESA